MQIQCSECPTIFTWTQPATGGGRPKTCSKECATIRQRKQYKIWKKAHPERATANQAKQYKKRKKAEKLPEYDSKDVPVKQPKNCCINMIMDYETEKLRRCRKVTGNGGMNRLYCSKCWSDLTNRCSMENSNYIYNTSNDDINIKNPHQTR